MIAAVVLAFGAYLLWSELFTTTDNPFAPAKAFYSVDDGKTLFTDSSDRDSPFDKDGKQALRVMVFTCDGGKTKLAGYLQRYTPLGAQKMAALREQQRKNPGKLPGLDPTLAENIEIKHPGDKDWVKQSDVINAKRILDVRCPDHNNAPADPVKP